MYYGSPAGLMLVQEPIEGTYTSAFIFKVLLQKFHTICHYDFYQVISHSFSLRFEVSLSNRTTKLIMQNEMV